MMSAYLLGSIVAKLPKVASYSPHVSIQNAKNWNGAYLSYTCSRRPELEAPSSQIFFRNLCRKLSIFVDHHRCTDTSLHTCKSMQIPTSRSPYASIRWTKQRGEGRNGRGAEGSLHLLRMSLHIGGRARDAMMLAKMTQGFRVAGNNLVTAQGLQQRGSREGAQPRHPAQRAQQALAVQLAAVQAFHVERSLRHLNPRTPLRHLNHVKPLSAASSRPPPREPSNHPPTLEPSNHPPPPEPPPTTLRPLNHLKPPSAT